MSSFGEMPFITVAVQVIPVLAIVLLADQFASRDWRDPEQQAPVAFGLFAALLAGAVGEWAGLQALLTGPTNLLRRGVTCGLIGLTIPMLLPRMCELFFSMHSQVAADLARRAAQRLVPSVVVLVPVFNGAVEKRDTVYIACSLVCVAALPYFAVRAYQAVRSTSAAEAPLRSSRPATTAVESAVTAKSMEKAPVAMPRGGWLIVVAAVVALVFRILRR